MSTHNPPSPNASLTSRMHRLAQRVNSAVLEAVRGAGFERVGAAHIGFLDQMGSGCRVGELARRLSVSPAAVSQLADQLEALGLVRRVRDPLDRRAVMVEPEAAVRRGWIVARQAVDDVESRWREELGEQRFSMMAEAIKQIASLDDD
jgi:DNA-binding MarR family transcriptional regulator